MAPNEEDQDDKYSVAVWNVVIGEQTILPTVDFGWNLRDVALDCIGRRRSSTGLID